MLPIKNILWPTDFSDPSYEALKVALEFATHFDAVLHIITVIPLVPLVEAPLGAESAGFNIAAYQNELEGHAKKSLKDIVEQRIGKDIKVVMDVSIGTAAAEIIRYATEKNIDLIVISTHGLSGWRKFISGSTTEQVVRQATCPVLTIHKPVKK